MTPKPPSSTTPPPPGWSSPAGKAFAGAAVGVLALFLCPLLPVALQGPCRLTSEEVAAGVGRPPPLPKAGQLDCGPWGGAPPCNTGPSGTTFCFCTDDAGRRIW